MMIRKLVYALAPVATALLLLASCHNEEMPAVSLPAKTDSPQKIHFELTYATPAVSQDMGTPATRISTSTDGSYTNSWEEGDKVGVYIVKGEAGLQNTGNWVDNMKMTYSNGNWSYTLPSGKEYYPVDEALSFYAYYPYDDAFTPTSQHLTLPTDQSGQTDITDMYLFTARTTGVQDSSEPVRLEFSSALTMIELTLKSEGDGGRLTDRIVPTLEECKTDLTLNLETGMTEAVGDVSPITLRRMEQPDDTDYRTNYTYHALVPAQTLTAGKEFRFTNKDVPDSRDLIYTLPDAVMLKPGLVKPFEITLKLALDPAHEYKVGDIYPHDGWPMGVVYEVDDEGQHGKIVYYEYTNTFWGEEQWIPDNMSSGKANMKAVYEANNGSFDGYPPFQWADSLNPPGTEYTEDAKGIWYLPARDEVRLMLEHWKPEIISSLQKISGISYPEEGARFGTSTSKSIKSYALFGYTSSGLLPEIGRKTTTLTNFFAVMEF